MENSVYKVAFVPDMLFNLCINKTMMLSNEKPITNEDRDWFDMRLKEADMRIRELISFLLCDETESDELSICYSLYRKYNLHFSMLPVKIENAIVAIVCSKWYRENGVNGLFFEDEAISELRSLALKQDERYLRRNNI